MKLDRQAVDAGQESSIRLSQPRLSLVAGGYIAAVVSASLAVVILLSFVAGVDGFISLVFIFGCAVTFACGLPGFIATVLIARCLGLRAWPFFVIAGGLDGVLSMVVFNDNMLKLDKFSFAVIAGGLAGGFVYWLLAYRLRRAET